MIKMITKPHSYRTYRSCRRMLAGGFLLGSYVFPNIKKPLTTFIFSLDLDP